MNKICGVIDFDGFDVLNRNFLVREFGFISIDWLIGESRRYDLSQFYDRLLPSDLDKVRDVENNILGMPFNPIDGELVHNVEDLDNHIKDFYELCKTEDRQIIGYKGGTYEKSRLDRLNIPSTNLEKFSCPKFDVLRSFDLERYNGITCGYHRSPGLHHCPRAEVTAFKEWICRNMFS